MVEVVSFPLLTLLRVRNRGITLEIFETVPVEFSEKRSDGRKTIEKYIFLLRNFILS